MMQKTCINLIKHTNEKRGAYWGTVQSVDIAESVDRARSVGTAVCRHGSVFQVGTATSVLFAEVSRLALDCNHPQRTS